MNEELASRLPPGQIVSRRLTVMSYKKEPELAITGLKVGGAVENPLELTAEELAKFGLIELWADFHCVTRWSKLNVHWAGVPTRAIVQAASPLPNALFAIVHCHDGYTTNIETNDLMFPTSILAQTLEGQPLPREHGGPLRLLLPHRYGWKSAKWISKIEFLTQEVLGFWEQRGYHRRGDFWLEERFSGD